MTSTHEVHIDLAFDQRVRGGCEIFWENGWHKECECVEDWLCAVALVKLRLSESKNKRYVCVCVYVCMYV